MSQTTTMLDQLWNTLSGTFNGTFELQDMPITIYMDHYNFVVKYFQSSEYSEALLRARNNVVKPNEIHQEEIIIPGMELYFKTKNFFRSYLENIAANVDNLEGEDFLRFYAKTWEKYQLCSKIANGILSVFNKNWGTNQRTDGNNGICNISIMAMQIWQEIFFKESRHGLTQTCLDLINEERNGAKISSSLIRQVVQSYVSAGFSKSENTQRNVHQSITKALVMYVDHFEKQFLIETEQFYKIEVQSFLETNSVIAYMIHITKRLQEEEGRVKEVLHLTTLEKLKPLLENILIKEQLERLYTEASKLLREGNVESLRILFELVNRIDGAHRPILDNLEQLAYGEAMHAIESISTVANEKPQDYVEAIIGVHQKWLRIVSEGFCKHPSYTAVLDHVFSRVVNDNAVTKKVKKSSKSPELIARYADMLLRKGRKLQNIDVEEKLNQIMMVFNYIKDKDVFLKFYGTFLGKRLIGQLSASNDHEELMISKLKAACGFEYASKLQRMFQDINLSADLMQQYRDQRETQQLTNTMDFSVMVLNLISWTFTASPAFILPTELKTALDSFESFYSSKYNSRKLSWLYEHSKGELKLLYTKQTNILQVSTYQMTVLLAFSEVDSLTVQEILDKTQIEPSISLHVLASLLKSKVLVSPQIMPDQLNNNFEDSDVKRDYVIQINESFENNKIKINLNLSLKSEQQKEVQAVDQSVEENRKTLVQAAIVRIMKTRKEIKSNALTQEVIAQLTSRFQPQVPMIKQCIEMLIEREYLERDSNERDRFRYLA